VTPPKTEGSEPIDAVYAWSEGDQLKYSLRSLGRFAPWIRKVHVVAREKAPNWLAGDHARLSLVKHATLLPAGANADLVAWQLFRIPGLSRQFLYLDGNTFLGQPLNATDFLSSKSGYRFFVEPSEIPPGSAAESLLNSRFGKRSPRKTVARTPHLLDRGFLEEVHRLWEKPIKQGGVSLPTLYFYYLSESPLQYKAHEQEIVIPTLYSSAPLSDRKLVSAMLSGGPKFFRLEGEASLTTKIALKLHFMRKSEFEK
jgi:hypothetical protein